MEETDFNNNQQKQNKKRKPKPDKKPKKVYPGTGTALRVRRDLNSRPECSLFTSRDLLHHGPRHTVDNFLAYLVRTGEIIRDAWGVFHKAATKSQHMQHMPPTLQQVIETKLQAFDRDVRTHGQQALDLAFADTPAKVSPQTSEGQCARKLLESQKYKFGSRGRTSQFYAHGILISIKQYAARKLVLPDTKIALLIRGLWETPKEQCDDEMAKSLMQRLGRQDREQLRRYCRYMPSWLSDWLVHKQPSPAALLRAKRNRENGDDSLPDLV